jgi:hypothetical protein
MSASLSSFQWRNMLTSLSLPDDVLRAAEQLAARQGSSLQEFVTTAVQHEIAARTGRAANASLPAIAVGNDAPVLRMHPLDISFLSNQLALADDAARTG